MPSEDAIKTVARNLQYWQDLIQKQRWHPSHRDDNPYAAILADHGYDLASYPAHYAERDEDLLAVWARALEQAAGSEAQDLRILDDMGLLLEVVDNLNVAGIRADGQFGGHVRFIRERHKRISIPWCFDRRTGSHDRSDAVRPDLDVRLNIFANSAKWFPSNVQCLGCDGGLYKTTFNDGFEAEARTTDPRDPVIRIRRLYTCQFCRTFVTTGLSEDEWNVAVQIGQPGYDLSGPTYFIYDCSTWDEYGAVVSALDPIAYERGRFDGGFLRGPAPTA